MMGKNRLNSKQIKKRYMRQLLLALVLSLPLLGMGGEKADTVKLRKGDKCPDYVFQSRDSSEVTLRQFRGRYVVIDVWASWCYPCKKEYPTLRALAEKYKDKNVVFVSLSCDRRKQDWLNGLWWEKMAGWQWWIAGDESSMEAFGVAAIPRLILLDKKGRVARLRLPKPSDPEFEKILRELKGL